MAMVLDFPTTNPQSNTLSFLEGIAHIPEIRSVVVPTISGGEDVVGVALTSGGKTAIGVMEYDGDRELRHTGITVMSLAEAKELKAHLEWAIQEVEDASN